MITLITGQPGDGKTLYTITAVKVQSEKDQRAVYYSGIPELRLPWIELPDPEKWYECEKGAIIVIDEAQRIFRPRGNGAAVPRHVAELETHRHKGFDLFIITQQPMLIDSNVRRLVGRHFHAKRKFGAPASTVHEWSQVKERPDQNRGESIRHEFIFPKASYALYKSAEIHTHKLRIPMRMWAMCALPIIFAGLVYGTVDWFKNRNPIAKPVPEVVQGEKRTTEAGPHLEKRDGPRSAADLVASYQPRVEGLAFTAPRYDSKVSPVAIPYPAACIATKARCQCYTQQATVLDVGMDFCRQIVAKGYFLDFDPGKPLSPGSDRVAPREDLEKAAPLPAEQAGFHVPATVASPARHTAGSEERSGDTTEGWRTDVRSVKPFVGPFAGVSGQ